jgi:hypothetical protein
MSKRSRYKKVYIARVGDVSGAALDALNVAVDLVAAKCSAKGWPYRGGPGGAVKVMSSWTKLELELFDRITEAGLLSKNE